jgi:hypothetical protein
VALWWPNEDRVGPDGQFAYFPTADYKIDGVSGESPQVALLDKTLT